MLVEAYFTMSTWVLESKLVVEAKLLVTAFDEFNKSDFIVKEEELQDINKEYLDHFLQLTDKVKDGKQEQLEETWIKTFRELKLGEPAMAISEKITEAFTQITKFQEEVGAEFPIMNLLTAYIDNAKGRLISCRRAFSSLQKLKATPSEASLDPKIFLVRLEAEAAFINKYLSLLQKSELPVLQSHAKYDILKAEIERSDI